ncbi:unnamed protein product [Acanthoscelides obtectus]|uniref:EB domain-containing protein n=1 Tax=Acanthoscelides obtectus TaxID=200917 RepID=A0A9P0Q737_ACAOB|nr:unnamed protein product [Acanthoscelides obtectus]CAK1659227.1 hypothetical protein AOBTE_LOCUS21357 [Acanthoscelides obtectus]
MGMVLVLLAMATCGCEGLGMMSSYGRSKGTPDGSATSQPLTEAGVRKPCTNQVNCTFIKGTTCLRGFCLCGDNTHPVNGLCSAIRKAPNHRCEKDEECVDGATCTQPSDTSKSNGDSNNGGNNNNNRNKNGGEDEAMICECMDGMRDADSCNGGSAMNLNLILMAALGLLATLNSARI